MKDIVTFEDAFDEIINDLKVLMVEKQRDYGSQNILACPMGAEVGVIVRISDKIQRLANLYKNKQKPKNEPIDDSWMDIANYAIIALMVRHKTFTKPLDRV